MIARQHHHIIGKSILTGTHQRDTVHNTSCLLYTSTYQCGFDMLNADAWGQVYWSAYKYANNGATLMVPSELIYAAGAIPIKSCSGSYTAFNVGDEVAPRDACPVIKSIIGFQI